jgi:hypothetical protein
MLTTGGTGGTNPTSNGRRRRDDRSGAFTGLSDAAPERAAGDGLVAHKIAGIVAPMIVGVPDHQTLKETAIGWMNLAWDTAIEEARHFQDVEYLYVGIEQEHGADVAQTAIAKHWRAKQLKLNNAFSLLQQSLEIALKARIAEVSPFILIAGDPRTWPKPKDGSNLIDFSSFRTIDAVQLCGAANAVSAAPLSKDFTEFYDRLRQSRNKIAHLNASAIIIEVKSLLLDILTAQRHLFPDVRWTTFRHEYLRSTEQYDDKDNLFSGDDCTCVYRKLMLGRNGDEVRPGWRMNRSHRFAEPGEKPAHLYPRPSGSASHYNSEHKISESGADVPRPG